MRITLFRVIVAIALLCGGGQGLYTAFWNLSPKEYAIQAFLAEKPATKWLRITGGELQLQDLVFSGGRFSGIITEVYLPLRPKNSDDDSAPIQVLVASKDPALLALATKLRDTTSTTETLKLLLKHEDVDLSRPINGLVRFGIDFKDKDERKLRSLHRNLASDFVLIDEGQRPDFGFPAFALAAGLALAFFMIRGPSRPASAPPPLPTAFETPPSLPSKTGSPGDA